MKQVYSWKQIVKLGEQKQLIKSGYNKLVLPILKKIDVRYNYGY